MRRSALAATAFAAAAGEPVDARAFLHVDDGPGPRGLMLVAAVEPTSSTAWAREVGVAALAALRDAFAASPDPDPAAALAEGLAAANDAVLAANRSAADGARVLVGFTAIGIAGNEACIAQAPPAQALLVRSSRVAAFPRLESWGPRWSGGSGTEATPLGSATDLHPTMTRALLAPNDLIVLLHSSMARAASAGDAVDPRTIASIRSGGSDAVLDRFAEFAAETDTGIAYAAAVRVMALGPAPVRTRSTVPERAASAPAARMTTGRTGRAVTRAGGIPAAAVMAADPGGVGVLDPAGHLRLALLGMVEALTPHRRQEARAAWKTAPPGADSISRFRGAGGISPDVRSRLPRVSGLGAGGKAIAAAGACCLLLGAASLGLGILDWRADRQAHAVAALDAALDEAAGGPAQALAMLDLAERSLAEAEAAGVPEIELSGRRAGVEAIRDQAWGIERVSGLRRVGALPAAMANGDVRLITAGVKAYVAGGGLYEVDAESGQLVEVLAPGQRIGDGVLGPIVDAAADRAGVIVSDGVAAYLQDETGAWERYPFDADAGVPGAPSGPTAAFNRAMYALDRNGSIVKYVQIGDRFSGAPWAAAGEFPDLADAVDIAVDDRVHVLLEDGRVVSFYRGVLEMGSVAPVFPEVAGPAFFAANGGSLALYIVEPEARIGDVDGRVIRFDLGGATQQFAAPVGDGDEVRFAMELFGRADQVAVSEPAGAIFLLVGGELWQCTLPPLVGA